METDYALLAVDLHTRKLIIYDPLEGRLKDTFLLEVKRVKALVKEMINHGVPLRENKEESEGGES
jgi:hypothetical protein